MPRHDTTRHCHHHHYHQCRHDSRTYIDTVLDSVLQTLERHRQTAVPHASPHLPEEALSDHGALFDLQRGRGERKEERVVATQHTAHHSTQHRDQRSEITEMRVHRAETNWESDPYEMSSQLKYNIIYATQGDE